MPRKKYVLKKKPPEEKLRVGRGLCCHRKSWDREAKKPRTWQKREKNAKGISVRPKDTAREDRVAKEDSRRLSGRVRQAPQQTGGWRQEGDNYAGHAQQ